MAKGVKVLSLLAGGGQLPALLADAALVQGYAVNVLSFIGQPQPEDLPAGIGEVAKVPLVKVGQILEQLAAWGTTHVALAGNLSKPQLLGARPDGEGVKLLASMGLARVGKGDDALLRAVTKRLTDAGYSVLGAADVSPQLLAPKGTLGKRGPAPSELADAETGRKVLEALGPFDVGQACVMHNGVVLGIEGPEGTDALLDRCALLRGTLKQREHAGILVKMAKPGQTELADLPTLGPVTLAKLAELNYVGAIVLAGRTLLLNQPEVVRLATAHHLLLHALDA